MRICCRRNEVIATEQEKIAILTDSGTDVPQEYIDRFGMYVLPLIVNYHDGSYRDKLEITSDEVASRLAVEIPKTSLPSPGEIEDAFARIKADGYNKVLAVTISSGLSGTCNSIRIVSELFPEMETLVVDTKNIGIGAGLAAISAGELISQGLPFRTIYRRLCDAVNNSAVFFCVNTLEYLEKGGRIGHVAAALGRVLNLKPIITCNKEGIYTTAAKVRGRAESLIKTLDLAKAFAARYDKCMVAVAEGAAKEEAARLFQKAAGSAFPNAERLLSGQISPALVVHTGPGLIGIGVQKVVF